MLRLQISNQESANKWKNAGPIPISFLTRCAGKPNEAEKAS